MILRRVLTILIFSLAIGSVYSQNEYLSLNKVMATSPQAASIGRYGDIPVGLYTGTPQISVPIFNLTMDHISLPVSLDYHSSGFRVQDEASMVGLGWTLKSGGIIIQQVNGVADNLDEGLTTLHSTGYSRLKAGITNSLYNERSEIGNTWPCMLVLSDPTADDADLLGRINTGHFQPDIYHYNFLGYAGKFYINPETNQVVLMDKKDHLVIEKTEAYKWKITTINGDIYYFDVYEETKVIGESYPNGYSWYLTKIVSHTGKEMHFAYSAGKEYGHAYSESYHSVFPFGIDIQNFKRYEFPNIKNTLYPKEIYTDEVKIQFKLEDRDDIFGFDDIDDVSNNGVKSVKRIKSIEITDRISTENIKAFDFTYNYFGYLNSGSGYAAYGTNDHLGKRLKLLSMQEKVVNGSVTTFHAPYSFEYEETILLPKKTSYSVDFFGFYNATNNTRLVPDLSFFYYAGFPEYQDEFPKNEFALINGANRTIDTTKLRAYVLNKISYPTGGYNLFRYEPHSFSNYCYPYKELVNASNVQNFVEDKNTNYPSSDVRHNFSFSSTGKKIIQFDNMINKGPNPSLTFDDLLDCTIKLFEVQSGNFTELKEWKMANSVDYRNTFNVGGFYRWQEDVEIDVRAGYDYLIAVYLPNGLGPQNTSTNSASVRSGFKYFNASPESLNTGFGGGIRVAEIENYSAENVMTEKTKFEYKNENGTSSGVLMSPLKLLHSYEVYFNKFIGFAPPECTWNCEQIYNDTRGKAWFISPQNFVPFSNSISGVIVGYSRVSKIKVDGNSNKNGSYVAEYNNLENEVKPNNPEKPKYTNGLLKRELIFLNNSSIPQSEKKFVYTSLETKSFSGVKISQQTIGSSPCESVDDYNKYPAGDFFTNKRYRIHFYPIMTEWFKLSNQETITREGGNTISSIVNYTYNSLGQNISMSSKNSKKEDLRSDYIYPVDVIASPGSIEELIQTNKRFDLLLEKKGYVNNSEVSRLKNIYKLQNKIVLEKSEFSLNQQPLAFNSLYDQYGGNGNLRSYTENGVRKSLIWSKYNSTPIAVVGGATIGSIFYTSFEENEQSLWWYNNAGLNNSNRITGKRSYDLSEGNLSSVFGAPSGSYILTYWRPENLGALSVPGTVTGYPLIKKAANGWKLYEHKISFDGTIVLSGTGLIDEVRVYPPGAKMVTYTISVSKGITSVNNEKNEIVYYEYDNLNRLHLIKDTEGKVLSRTCYNYAGMVEDCGNEPVYYNLAKSAAFTRNNCGAGYTGSTVTYTVPANKYSEASALEADALAQADIDNNGQTYANINGTCTVTSSSIYVRIEMDDLYEYTEGENGPWAYYDQLEHHVNMYLRFYSDAACTTPYVLNTAITYSLYNYYTVHDQIGTIINSGSYNLGDVTVTPNASSLFIAQPGYIFYKRLEYDENDPNVIVYESLESNTFTISTTGTSFTPVATKYNFTRHPQYYYND